MKILIVDTFQKTKVVESDNVPRVGDKVNMGFIPYPKVASVLWWPDVSNYNERIDADVMVVLS